MFILYTKPTCAFSTAVEEYARLKGIQYDKRDIAESDEHKKELLAQGGEIRTPYLLDTETGVGMYESKRIIEYLEKHIDSSPTHHDSHLPQGTCSPQFEEGDAHR